MWKVAAAVSTGRIEARTAEATASFERAVEIKPGLPQARFNLAAGLLKMGRFNDVLGYLETLAAENPNDKQMRQYLQFARTKLREAAKLKP